MKILLAVDGSDYTNRMLSYLIAHKEWSKAGHAFTVFHAVLPVPHRAAAFAGPDLVHGYYEDDARTVLEPVRSLLAEHGIEARFEHRIGHPAEEISSFAQKGQFDLLIMGSRGHGTLANLVLGSVANKVLAGCTVPVLLVR
jgi:nucleotide-binding universal stress UspA family protein